MTDAEDPARVHLGVWVAAIVDGHVSDGAVPTLSTAPGPRNRAAA
jgi:hypothetical protein